MLLVFIILAIVLIFALSLLSFFRYRSEIMGDSTDLAINYAKTGSAYIDGDRVPGYLQSGKTDAYYEEVMNFLNAEAENSEMKCYYVIVPEEEDYVYVWDAESEENARDAYPLGYREAYSEEGKKQIGEVFTKDPQIHAHLDTNVDYGRVVCLYYPIFESSGDPVALVGVELSLPELYTAIFHVFLILILCMIPIVLIAVLIAFRFLQTNIVYPLQILSDTASHMVAQINEEETILIPIHTGDEIEDLAHAFEGMYRELKEYIRKLSEVTAEKERVRTELDVAAQIQSDILPSIFPAFQRRNEFDLYASMTPAKEVGGDFYDFFMVNDGQIALVIADVSDKGVPAAMFMVIAKTLLKNALQSGLSPKAALEDVNNQLCENNKAGMFVTAWIGLLTISSGRLVCANAGHEYPALCRKDSNFELFRDPHGFVLAGIENSNYQEYELSLSPGDTIFVYTDGVTEATNSQNQLFGTERMLQALNQGKTDSSEEQVRQLYRGIAGFVQDAPQFDDITMLCLKFKAKQKILKLSELTVNQQPALTEFIETAFQEWQVSKKAIVKMDIALDEIYSNIVRYSGADFVTLLCGVSEETAYLQFEDDGIPFNPLEEKSADPTLPLTEREIGGLGIFMVKNSMDRMEYHYTDGKNILSLELDLF